jgi:translation initiation factor IF-1
MSNTDNIIVEGEVIKLSTGNTVLVRLSNSDEIEVAVNKSLVRSLYKIYIGDIFAIKMLDSPKLSRAYVLLKRGSIEER